MTTSKKQRSFSMDDLEQMHNALAKSTQELFRFLLDDHGFSPPACSGFNRQTREGSTTLSYQKEVGDSSLIIVVAMEYTAAWVILVWTERGRANSVPLGELMKLRCPELNLLTEAVDAEQRCQHNLHQSARALHDHFSDLLQGDFKILRKGRRHIAGSSFSKKQGERT
jgi:hypothetical protein